MLEIAGLTRRFGRIAAVDQVSFTLDAGEVLGFLGPNGAGKSTSMKMIAGALAISDGTVRVCGHDVATDRRAAQRCLGYLPEGAPLYPDMTPRALLDTAARLRGYNRTDRRRQIDWTVGRLELQSAFDRPIETLSKGFKRRVALAQAILHQPELLILDEPTDGLDPNQKHEVRGLLRELAHDRAILISTHVLEEVEAMCSRCIVISAGRTVVDSTPAELAARGPLDQVFRHLTRAA
ncbi:ABC transporter ATP-binding protein [Rhodovibrio salinarum]|uniref:ABC transporter ATP-binding protein n=1 Tax=Rhodovibrio salinarum TaxID=1087 RepID=A0A934V332_9PROT|nr:ABC transporter ATP-binding protein [Rhodovibrio salinarum]